MEDGVVERRAARVLLVDDEGRLLLFEGTDPAKPAAGTWWFTPGGGLDEGESHEQAAVREVFEETGLRLPVDALGEVVLEREAAFELAGTAFRQRERFYRARVAAHDVDTSGFSAFERDCVVGHRWWTPAELRATADAVFPEGLADLVDP